MATLSKRTDMNLKDLDPLAKKLAGASDELNSALQQIQDTLNSKQLGVEVFLDDRMFEELQRTASRRPEQDNLRDVQIKHLGYGKDDDGKWCLLVRTWTGTQSLEGGIWVDDDLENGEIFVTPLLRAPRAMRGRAVELLERLLEKIQKAAEDVVSQVERAKELAKSLE